MRWTWWDWSLSLGTLLPSVLWHCRFGWVIWPAKTVPEMTYNVFSGTLNPAHFTSLRVPFIVCLESHVLSNEVAVSFVNTDLRFWCITIRGRTGTRQLPSSGWILHYLALPWPGRYYFKMWPDPGNLMIFATLKIHNVVERKVGICLARVFDARHCDR